MKFFRYFRTYPFRLKVKQKDQKLLQKYYIYYIASSQSAITGTHEGLSFTIFNNFTCITSNKHPGMNYLKLWLMGGALIKIKSLNPGGVLV